MIELKKQYPYIDENGVENKKLVKMYAEDERGNQYYIKQTSTNTEYIEAVDVYPSRYYYVATNRLVEDLLNDLPNGD